MLMANFKTPTDLGISDAEFDALAKVLGMLEREEITAADFDMTDGNSYGDCNAPCCIVGHARRLGAFRGKPIRDMKRGLTMLFAPAISASYRLITPAQAAIALRCYLRTGDPRWTEALAE